MDKIVAGGVNIDINDAAGKFLLIEIEELRAELAQIIPAIDLSSSLEDRIYTAGYLSPHSLTNKKYLLKTKKGITWPSKAS